MRPTFVDNKPRRQPFEAHKQPSHFWILLGFAVVFLYLLVRP